MRIDALRILSYGKFKDTEISFDKNINIVLGKNEAGKSTIMAFIKAMLYGFTGRGNEGDRKRYMPWDGGVLAGEMMFTAKDQKQYIIRRKSGRTPAQDTCDILDAVTGEPASLSLEEEIGIGENGFLKTLFVRNASIGVHGGDDELTDKLINLTASGDEDTGYHRAVDILKDAMRVYKHQRGTGGKISALQQRIMELDAELLAAEAENRALLFKMTRLETLRREIPQIQERLKAQDGGKKTIEIRHVLADIAEAKRRVSSAEKELAAANVRFDAVKEKMQKFSAFDRPIRDIVYIETEDAEKLFGDAVIEKKRAKRLLLFVPILLLASILMLWLGSGIMRFLIGALCIGVVAALFFIARKRKGDAKTLEEKAKKAELAKKEKEEELSHFGCTSLQAYTEAVAEKTALCEKETLVLQYVKECEARTKSEKEELIRLYNRAEQFGSIKELEALDIDAAEREAANLQRLLDESQREMANIEGVLLASMEKTRLLDVIRAEKYEAGEQLAEAKKTYDALFAAEQALGEAFGELSHDFTPKMNALASEYLSAITGKQEKILLDKQYNVTMDRYGHHGLQFFSGGTIDQAYLAVRLAMITLLFDTAPIFLDDVFFQYDDERTQNAMQLLRTLLDKRQIILFSCRELCGMENTNIIRL